ncbi:MAG: SDR family oxidoreductase [Betaproteobacteria bacterium]|nr:SDR family oxidoreductase [Betaproteobacteria bacterium]
MTPRTVLVTGASSGIGAALVAEYAQRGWRVAMVARRADALQLLADQLGLDEQRAFLMPCDMRDVQAWRAQAARLLAAWGCPDVVIANAGISVGVLVEDPADHAVFNDVMTTNWLGTIATLQPFVTLMRTRGAGTLVGVASVAGMRGLAGHAAYSASKAATIKSLESLRLELRGTGVRVVTLCPGYIATPLTSKNPFSMPFLMQPQAFARQAARAIERGVPYRTIPWQMGVVSLLLRVAPIWLYDRVLSGRARKPRAAQGGGGGATH